MAEDEKRKRRAEAIQLVAAVSPLIAAFITVAGASLLKSPLVVATAVTTIPIWILVFLFYLAFYRIKARIEGSKKGPPRYPRARLWALVGIGAVFGLVIAMSIFKPNRAFIATMWLGTPTPTPTPTHTATPTVMDTPIPTSTYTPTPTAVPATPTPTPTPTHVPTATPVPNCTYDARTILLGTYPQNTSVTLGQRLVRVWRIYNTGSCVWNSEVEWVFVSESGIIVVPQRNRMHETSPGERVEIEELIIAPSEVGHFAGEWQMRDPSGYPFADKNYLEIDVHEPVPPALIPKTCASKAVFAGDSTYPDGTEVAPGQRIYKVWSMYNAGDCPWNGGYRLVHVGGPSFEAPASVEVPYTLPGETADIIVEMITPAEAGTYQSDWRLQDPFGTVFGIKIVIRITVVQ